MTYNKRELFYKSQSNAKGKRAQNPPKAKETGPEKEISIGESEVRDILATRKGVNASTLHFALRKMGTGRKDCLFLLCSKDPSVTIPQSTICEVIAEKYGIDRNDAGDKVHLHYDVQTTGKKPIVNFKKAVASVPLAPEHPDERRDPTPTKIVKTKYTPG